MHIKIQRKVVCDKMVNIGNLGGRRNVGIDLIRIICMFMVLTLHVIGTSELINKTQLFSLNYNILKFITVMSTPAVDCFALITGYIYFDMKFKYSRIINLWLTVLFYTVFISLLFSFFSLDCIGFKDIVRMFFPIMGSWYWYFTAYFGLFFLIPFINIFLRQVSKDNLKKLIFTLVMLFSILNLVAVCGSGLRDLFGVKGGYSTVWLVILYILGASLKIFEVEKYVSKKLCVLIYLVACIVGFIGRMATDFVTLKYLGKITKYNNFLLEYTSPIILLMAVSLFLFCIKIDFKEMGLVSKIITWFAPMSFAVYVIHHNKFPMRWFTRSKILSSTVNLPAHLMIIKLIEILLVIYVGCSLIDYFRIKLFKALKIKLLSEKIENLFRLIFIKIKNKFLKFFNIYLEKESRKYVK